MRTIIIEVWALLRRVLLTRVPLQAENDQLFEVLVQWQGIA